MSFAERLKEQLEKNHMTQDELAKRTGITAASICRYVSGQRVPKGIMLGKIATALGTSCDYLLGISDKPSNGYWTSGDCCSNCGRSKYNWISFNWSDDDKEAYCKPLGFWRYCPGCGCEMDPRPWWKIGIGELRG